MRTARFLRKKTASLLAVFFIEVRKAVLDHTRSLAGLPKTSASTMALRN